MELFIKKLLYFTIPILVFIYPLDYITSFIFKQNNSFPGEYEVWNDIYSSNADCDIAIYGSSRAWVHINPQILKDSLGVSAYNFGIDGHNFWLQYLRHKEFIRFNKKPKTIIMAVDIFSLQKRETLYELNQFLPYMLWNSNIQEFTESYIGFDQFDYYLPMIRYFGQYNLLIRTLIKIQDQNKTKFRKNGYAAINRVWNDDLKRARKNRSSYKVKLDSASIVLFKKFIKECKNDSIELKFVYTPEYIEGQNFVSNRSTVLNLYKEIAKAYSIPFFDYSKDDICLDKNLFYNASHLNSNGSYLFSLELAKDLKN